MRMVSSKKVHCAYCQKKCSGSVLRYQDQYYHKQCFELLQSEFASTQSAGAAGQRASDSRAESAASVVATSETSNNNNIESNRNSSAQQQRQVQEYSDSESPIKHQYYHSKTSKTTTTTTTRQQKFLDDNSNPDLSVGTTAGSGLPRVPMSSASYLSRGKTLGSSKATPSSRSPTPSPSQHQQRSATLPHSISAPLNGFDNGVSPSASSASKQLQLSQTQCAGCKEKINDGQALIALDLHWHVWCFKCSHCKVPLHGEYVAKDGRAYCEKDYQKLFGITCVYCKRYITGKVLQAGETHHFHPSCARCSKCGDPFVPGEEMYLQGEVTWHPRCGPGPGGLPLSPSQINDSNSMMGPGEESALESAQSRSQSHLRAPRAHSPSLSSRSRSASPFSYMSRQQYGRASPAFTESEAVGDLSRIYTISYLNADPNQGYLRRPIEPYPPKSPQFSRPTSLSRIGDASDRFRCSSRSQQLYSASSRERSQPAPRGMYSVLSSIARSGTSSRARSPSMMNEEAIQLAAYPSGQKPSPDALAKIERDDFPAPPFPYPHRHHHQRQHKSRGQSAPRTTSVGGGADSGHEQTIEPSYDGGQQQERASRPRSREYVSTTAAQADDLSLSSNDDDDAGPIDPQLRKEEEELSKIANGIGKIFLQTLKEREKLRAWKRANLDPRNASRTPSATRELPSKPLRYENPTNASPSRDLDRPRPWDSSEMHEDNSEHSPTRTRSSLGRMTPAIGAQSSTSSTYGYKVVQANRHTPRPGYGVSGAPTTTTTTTTTGLNGASELSFAELQRNAQARAADLLGKQQQAQQGHSLYGFNRPLASSASAYLRRSMPNVANSRDSTLSHHQHLDGPPKLYPYHLLATNNYRLPPDVDRCHLERHLSNEEFQYIFHCDRLDFYRLPEWKRNELKRRAKLF